MDVIRVRVDVVLACTPTRHTRQGQPEPPASHSRLPNLSCSPTGGALGILPLWRYRAGLAGGVRSVPWRVLDRAERPVAVQPGADCVVEHRVKRRMVRAYPGTDGRMPSARLRMVRALVARRVDIDAADDLAGCGAEHGVGESAACDEVLCVAFEVAQVFRQAHLVRPAGPGKSRRGPDVAGAGRPCGVVSGVVLGPERFQPELPGRKAIV